MPPTLLLALDFDGVLHRFFPKPGSDAENAYFASLPRFEACVRELQKSCHVEIVITSTWRRDRTLEALRGFFSPDIQPLIVGKTPLVESGQGPGGRQAELDAWLREHGRLGQPWIALDDIAEIYSPGAALVLCHDEFAEREYNALLEAARDPAAWARNHPVPSSPPRGIILAS